MKCPRCGVDCLDAVESDPLGYALFVCASCEDEQDDDSDDEEDECTCGRSRAERYDAKGFPCDTCGKTVL